MPLQVHGNNQGAGGGHQYSSCQRRLLPPCGTATPQSHREMDTCPRASPTLHPAGVSTAFTTPPDPGNSRKNPSPTTEEGPARAPVWNKIPPLGTRQGRTALPSTPRKPSCQGRSRWEDGPGAQSCLSRRIPAVPTGPHFRGTADRVSSFREGK